MTNKFLDDSMLLNCLSLLKIGIHNANKAQTTADIFPYSVLSVDTLLCATSVARRYQIVYLEGPVGKTGIFHYCFPSVKFDLFSYPVLAAQTNHALIHFSLSLFFIFLVAPPFGENTPCDLSRDRLAQCHSIQFIFFSLCLSFRNT